MNYEEMNNNKVELTGTVVSAPEFSHEVFGEGFYECILSVKRLSEQCDEIPITISERLLAERPIEVGEKISIEGQFRSYNKIVDDKSKLMLTVFVRDIVDIDEEKNPNMIEITGYICKPHIYRTTPFKREICDVLLAVNRAYNKSDYIPCITWGRNARFIKSIDVGSKIVITGRIQSRIYQKAVGENEYVNKVAYEVSVNKINILEENNLSRQDEEQLYS